jgi:hypothetical protein
MKTDKMSANINSFLKSNVKSEKNDITSRTHKFFFNTDINLKKSQNIVIKS